MNQNLFLLLLIIGQVVSAQKKTYHDKHGAVVGKNEAYYYKVLSKTDDKIWRTEQFYVSGIQNYEGHSIKKDGSEKIGTHYFYYPSGKLKSKSVYLNKQLSHFESYYKSSNIKRTSVYNSAGLKESVLIYYDSGPLNHEVYFSGPEKKRKLMVKSYYKSGELKRDDQYVLDTEGDNIDYELVKGLSLSKEGDEISHTPFMRLPAFKGGSEALEAYYRKNFRYPSEAIKQESEGRVFVSFNINKNGKISRAKIKISADYRLNEEALRLVNNMPDWEPGILYGKKTNFNFVIPINFKSTAPQRAKTIYDINKNSRENF